MNTVTRVYGDNSPINFLVSFKDSGPVDLSAYTVKVTVEQEDGTSIVSEATTGVTVQPTQTFTASATTDLLTCYEHGVQQGDQVLLTTTGTLPAGLSLATRYFVIQRSDISFGLSALPNGKQIDITDAGSGTHTFAVVGSGQYSPQSTYAVGKYRVWVVLSGSTKIILPERRYGVFLDVVPLGN